MERLDEMATYSAAPRLAFASVYLETINPAKKGGHYDEYEFIFKQRNNRRENR